MSLALLENSDTIGNYANGLVGLDELGRCLWSLGALSGIIKQMNDEPGTKGYRFLGSYSMSNQKGRAEPSS